MIEKLRQWLRQRDHSDARRATARNGRIVKLAMESLEDRTVPAGNIAITNAYLVNASDQPLSAVTAGQAFYVQCTFTASGLPSNADYDVSYTVNGVTENSISVTWGAGSSGTLYCYMYCGAWTAQAGTNRVSATLDPNDAVPETTYSDNSTSFTFTAIQPSIQITSVSLVNANDQPITFVAAGQPVYVQANYIANNLPTGATYTLSYDVNGVTLTSGPIAWGAGSSSTEYCYLYCGAFTPTAGANSASVTVNINEPCTTVGGVDDFTAANANPTAADGYSALPASDTLFGSNGPSYLDVEQGGAGDCWLIASLSEVAARDPQAIKNMFTYDGTAVENGSTVGLYTVRFYNSNNVPEYVTVDTELPNGGYYYDVPTNGVMWVSLAEKAYVIANSLGHVTTASPSADSYTALNGGQASWALQAILGAASSFASVNPTNIAAAWNAGDFIVLTTTTPSSGAIVGSHAYALIGYNASSGQPYTLMNPWGVIPATGYAPEDGGDTKFGLFSCDAVFVEQNFNGDYMASAANTTVSEQDPLLVRPRQSTTG